MALIQKLPFDNVRGGLLLNDKLFQHENLKNLLKKFKENYEAPGVRAYSYMLHFYNTMLKLPELLNKGLSWKTIQQEKGIYPFFKAYFDYLQNRNKAAYLDFLRKANFIPILEDILEIETTPSSSLFLKMDFIGPKKFTH